jgi:hypothetical protein
VVLLNDVVVTRDGEGGVGQAATTKMALFPCDGRRRGGCEGGVSGGGGGAGQRPYLPRLGIIHMILCLCVLCVFTLFCR